MSERTMTPEESREFSLTTLALLILPLIVLGGVILLFVNTGGGLDLAPPAPVELLAIERTVLKPGMIEVYVRNSGPEDVTIAQAIINDAIWPVVVSPDQTIPRLNQAVVHFDYGWSYGEAYEIVLLTSNSIPFQTEIPIAFETPVPTVETFLSFTLIGLYVGVIPVFLGIFWFPALRRLGRRWMVFLMALTAGLLIFLGLDTLAEALEQAGSVPPSFQPIGLIGIGVIGTFFLLLAISRRGSAVKGDEADKRLRLAYMIALGIGLHNLGEGLAIGAAYNVGEIALGAFLVIGFIIQNITEGLGIIAPVLRSRPPWFHLGLMGLLAGVPAIIGSWIGAFTPSPTLAVVFLAVGTGAIFEVVYEIARLVQKDTAQKPMPVTVFSGILAGMLLLWVTGLMVK